MVRQKRMPWGRHSTSLSIEAPVVVNPDIVSNIASVTLSMYPPMRNGSMPNIVNTTHADVTSI